MKKFLTLLAVLLPTALLHAQEPDSLFVTGLEGLVTQLSDSTAKAAPENTPLTPVTTETDITGIRWSDYETDGLALSANVRSLHRYGRYYLVDVILQNNSGEMFNLDFDGIRLTTDKGRSLKVFSRDRFIRRVHRKQNWRHFGTQVALIPLYVFAAAAAERITDFDDDGWHSLGESLAEGVAYGVLDGAFSIGSAAIAAHYFEASQKVHQENLGYLHDCTILPGNAVRGHFFARYSPSAQIVYIDIPLGTRACRISFFSPGIDRAENE